jgi:hypothetical protein
VALAVGCRGGDDENSSVPTTVTVRASATKIPAADTLTLTATVASSKAVTGTVNFWENGKDGALAPPGTYEIYAQYSGDANNRALQSSTIDVVVTGSARVQIQGTTGPVTHYASVNLTIQ